MQKEMDCQRIIIKPLCGFKKVQKMNMQQHIMTAGNVSYANHKPSERRTVSGDSPHGEFAVTFSYSENIPILRNFL